MFIFYYFGKNKLIKIKIRRCSTLNKRHNLLIVSAILPIAVITFNNKQNDITIKEVFNEHIIQIQNKRLNKDIT